MQRSLFLKLSLIGVVALLLQIPVALILGLVAERQQARNAVVADVARGTAEAQRVAGPFLHIPWTRRIPESKVVTDESGRSTTTRWERTEAGHVSLLPAQLNVVGKIALQPKHRNLYTAHVFRLDSLLSGSFVVPPNLGLPAVPGSLEIGQPRLVLGLQDPRGIRDGLTLVWNGLEADFLPGGIDAAGAPSGVHALLPPLGPMKDAVSHEFRIALPLAGTERLSMVPAGAATSVQLSSPWPHPGFFGRILPEAGLRVGPEGFSASWRSTHLATNLPQLHRRCIEARECDAWRETTLGVSFIQPVDLYHTVERSVKYGLVFIVLTFAAFFLFEVLKRVVIHPIQYGLVGVALALFFLLLVSLSEHLGFLLAYVIATSACVGLIGFYVIHVLHSAGRGLAFSLGLALLYALLYVILRAEDHALLMGSIVMFAAVAAVMITTRRVDWYHLSAGPTEHQRVKPA